MAPTPITKVLVATRAIEASAAETRFRSEHLLADLRKRAVSGALITAVAQVCKLGLNLISAAVLARLLMPVDFGFVAMVTTITGFLVVFKDAGLSTATIQKAEITHAQVSNLFWVNVLVSAGLSLIVAVLAPVVAWFYREPRLVAVTLALSGTFALSGAVVQHQALFKREMRFKVVACIDVASGIVGLLIGVTMACLGCRYWSLVGMQLASGSAELVLTLCLSNWRPQWPTRGKGTLSLIHFGASLTLSSIFRSIASGTDSLLIGRRYGPAAVGMYTRAAVLLLRPIAQVTGPFESVFTPTLSRLQVYPQRYRRTFLQAYSAVALLSFSAAGLFMALSRPLVLVLLGPKWDQVVPLFAWFTVAGVFWPLHCVVTCLLNTQGRSRDIMTTGMLFSAITVGAFIAGLPFGPVGVAASFSCFSLLLRLPLQYYIVGRCGPVSTGDLWAVVLRFLPNWAAVFGAAYVTLRLLPPNWPSVLQLCVCVPVGVVAAIVMTLGVPSQRREALRLWELLRPFIGAQVSVRAA